MKKTLFSVFVLLSIIAFSCKEEEENLYPSTFEFSNAEMDKIHVYVFDNVGNPKELNPYPKHFGWLLDSIRTDINKDHEFYLDFKSIEIKDKQNIKLISYDDDILEPVPYTQNGNTIVLSNDFAPMKFEWNQAEGNLKMPLNSYFYYVSKTNYFSPLITAAAETTDLNTELKSILSTKKLVAKDTFALVLGKIVFKKK